MCPTRIVYILLSVKRKKQKTFGESLRFTAQYIPLREIQGEVTLILTLVFALSIELFVILINCILNVYMYYLKSWKVLIIFFA